MPVGITNQPQIDVEVKQIAKGLSSQVIDITFDIGEDWSGDPAIFFHVILFDGAAKGVMLGRVTAEVRKRLADMLRKLNVGLIGYSDFHSQSEQVELKRHQGA